MEAGKKMLNGKIISECASAGSVNVVRRLSSPSETRRKPDSLHGHFLGRLKTINGLASKNIGDTYQEGVSDRPVGLSCGGFFPNRYHL